MLNIFKSTKYRFYLIVALLILVLGVWYLELTGFFRRLSLSSERAQAAIAIARDIQTLQEAFWRLRFWEKSVQTLSHPEADQQFGVTIQEIKERIAAFDPGQFTAEFSGKPTEIAALLARYEEAFNHLMQFETEQRLNRTEIDSTYQVLASTILMNQENDLLKPLLNLNRFLTAYLQNRRESEFKALMMVFKFLSTKLSQSNIMDTRLNSYLTKFDEYLRRNFELEQEIITINGRFDNLSSELMELFVNIAQTAEVLSEEAVTTGKYLRDTVYQWFFLSAGIVFILLLALLTILDRTIIHPIRQLSAVVFQIQTGKSDARFTSKARDEIAELGFALNDMLDTIHRHQHQLEDLVRARTNELSATNEKLQGEVLERKRAEHWLRSANEELQQTLDSLRRTQDQLVESEKMAALGQLVAGVAHEINTPLGAIRSSIKNISNSLDETLTQLPYFFESLSNTRRDDFFRLLQLALQKRQPLAAKEERKFKRALARTLQEHGLDYAPKVAEKLVNIGVYDNLDPFLDLFKSSDSSAILDMVYRLSGLHEGTRIVHEATDRVSKVVFALKTYARYDHSGEKVEADITEGVETVLTLYHNQIKHGVDVIRNYDAIPRILCYPDELNQVWTNLIHNALQAMEYEGRLIISTAEQDGQVVISINDSGPGIPAEIQARIFEPFFTTKPAGEGSGLGLDIVRKIIDKHQGSIHLQSQPGEGATFIIQLPKGTDYEQ